MFDPQTKTRANGKPRILVCDGFGTHETLEIIEFCLENNIILCRLPSHTSHKTQPCDVSVFGPLKTAYRDEVERRYPAAQSRLVFVTGYAEAEEYDEFLRKSGVPVLAKPFTIADLVGAVQRAFSLA